MNETIRQQCLLSVTPVQRRLEAMERDLGLTPAPATERGGGRRPRDGGERHYTRAYRRASTSATTTWLWEQDLYGQKARYLGAGHGWAGNLYPRWRGHALLRPDQQTQLKDRTLRGLAALARVDGELANNSMLEVCIV